MVLFAAAVAYPSVSFLRSATTPHARRLSCFTAAIGFWYLVWGVFNTTIVGPLGADSVLFFVVLGLVVGARVSAAVGDVDADEPEAERLCLAPTC